MFPEKGNQAAAPQAGLHVRGGAIEAGRLIRERAKTERYDGLDCFVAVGTTLRVVLSFSQRRRIALVFLFFAVLGYTESIRTPGSCGLDPRIHLL